MTATTEHERVVELIRAKTIVPASIARNDAEAERVLAELADAVLAALAVPATPDKDAIERGAEAYYLASERDLGFTDSAWSRADEGTQEQFRWAAAAVLGAVPATEEVEWEYGCRSSSHSGFMRSVLSWDAEDEVTWREHLAECPSPAAVRRVRAGMWQFVEVTP